MRRRARRNKVELGASQFTSGRSVAPTVCFLTPHGVLVPVSFETSRGLADVASKREYLKSVEKGEASWYSFHTPSIAPSACAVVVDSTERSLSSLPLTPMLSPS
uniref:Uncharacterized protein n=1 Tax=Chrysotila carterae TaxID=13221 RepID=A0A7S4BS15_CHRCT